MEEQYSSDVVKAVIELIDQIEKKWRNKKISNRQIVQEIRSIREEVADKFNYEEANYIFDIVLPPIEESLYATSSEEGKKAYELATEAFKTWHETFRKPIFIRKLCLLNLDEVNYSDVYKESISNKDHLSQVKKALANSSEKGRLVAASLTQAFIEKKLTPLLNGGFITDQKAFARAVDDINSILYEEEKRDFEEEVTNLQKKSTTNTEEISRRKNITAITQKVFPYLNQ